MTAKRLRELREDATVDQTLQNMLKALSLNLELRARYRVFEFEASQDHHLEAAALFRDLRRANEAQIAMLKAGLRVRLDEPAPSIGDNSS